MKVRIVTGAAIIALVVVAFALDHSMTSDTGFTILAFLVCVAAWWEYSSIAVPGGRWQRWAGALAVFALLGAVWIDYHP